MISIYKPNKKNEGCACSFSLSNDNTVFINAVQQFSWDESKRTGSFNENAKNKDKSIAVKLSDIEVGGLIHAIRTYTEFKMFHSYEDNKTAIDLTTWTRKGRNEGDAGIPAFGLSITRNGSDKFKLPLELQEAELIMEFLKSCLRKNFADAHKKFSDGYKKKDSSSQ